MVNLQTERGDAQTNSAAPLRPAIATLDIRTGGYTPQTDAAPVNWAGKTPVPLDIRDEQMNEQGSITSAAGVITLDAGQYEIVFSPIVRNLNAVQGEFQMAVTNAAGTTVHATSALVSCPSSFRSQPRMKATIHLTSSQVVSIAVALTIGVSSALTIPQNTACGYIRRIGNANEA